MLNGLSKQRDNLMGSLRALYEEGVVQPLVFTILPPPREPGGISWTMLGNLGGSLGRFTIPKAN